MKVYLCRHGQTTGDIEDRYGGDYDDHLSEKGKKQANELASSLSNLGIEIVFNSPRIRAVETAEIISKKLGIKTIEAKNLRERNNYGVLTGLVKSEAKLKYPQEVAKLAMDELRHKITGSEEYDSFKERIIAEFKRITSKNKYKTICIISHGGPIKTIFRELFNLGKFDSLGDCASIEIDFENEEFSVVAMKNASLKIKNT
ncbi:MAG: histidine phosphatase family protein [Candidatus Diapherotrites archaeon]|nr:histidine phosphatase family protein [Candidatus Diapherotrites archaeon]